jgi:hypothetical protein
MMYFLRAPLVWLRWFIWDMHYNMVYDFIINTPSITIFPGVSIGGFTGKELSDICAIQSVTTPASFWVKNPDQCLDNIHKMVNGYAILFWWPFWLFLAWRLFWYGLARSCERPAPMLTQSPPPSPNNNNGNSSRAGTPRRLVTEEQRLNALMTRRANAQRLLEHRDLVSFCRRLIVWGEKHPDGRLNDFPSFSDPPSREVLLLDAVPAGTAIMTR